MSWPPRPLKFRRASLAFVLIAGGWFGTPSAGAVFVQDLTPALHQTLESCIAEQLPNSGSQLFSIRCGSLKLYGIATVRNENGTKVCIFGPVVAPSEGEQLATLPDSWRTFPFAQIRLERIGSPDAGVEGGRAAPRDSWVVEVPRNLQVLIAQGDCTVGRYEADPEADGSRAQARVSYVQFDEIASVHRRALQGWELAARVRDLRVAAADESLDEDARRVLDAARTAAEDKARAWLRRGVCLPPPYALALIAWIEEMDARQYVHRALGEVKAADRVTATIRAHAQAIGANGLLQLLGERVPAEQDGATSLCLHRCWVSDASEVNAIGTREHSAQQRFVADLRSALSRESDCGKEVVEVAGRSLDRLLGTLPPSSRFDERIKGIAIAELSRFCGATLDQHMLHVTAMTIALKVYTASWSEEVKRYPELANRLAEWHETLRREVASTLESPAYASALPEEDMQVVLMLALERIESVMNDEIGYFTALPPSTALQQQLLERYREFAASRGISGRESTEANRRSVAYRVTSDLFECLYEGTALQAMRPGDPGGYPQPFEFAPKSFQLRGQRMSWSIGP
jgi:hypothetical protein